MQDIGYKETDTSAVLDNLKDLENDEDDAEDNFGAYRSQSQGVDSRDKKVQEQSGGDMVMVKENDDSEDEAFHEEYDIQQLLKKSRASIDDDL